MDAPTLPFRLPLIAILRGITTADIEAHVGVLVEEGFDAIEVPTNSPEWTRSVAIAARAFPTDVWIGAGTVLTTDHVDALQAAGGRLAVTPNTDPSVIRHAVERGLLVAAGCATPSEAIAAFHAGAHLLKLFPASVLGPAMVRALQGVLPPIPLFAVGGVTPGTLPGFLSSGCAGAGIGGELYKPGQSVDATRAHARAFRQAYLGHAA